MITLVAAVGMNNAIGRNGRTPWHIPSDLRHFKALTYGKTVIMGRKTFQAIGKPLAGRTNIVLSRDPKFAPDGAYTASSFDHAMEIGYRPSANRELMVIGGEEVYRLAMPYAVCLCISLVHAAPADADAFFPEIPPGEWTIAEKSLVLPTNRDDQHEWTFLRLIRTRL